MAELIRFHYDPRCPWCYQTSRWAKDLERLGEIEIEWGLFCLEIANLPDGQTLADLVDPVSGPAMRTAIAIRDTHGRKALGPFFTALGKRLWHQPPMPTVEQMPDAVRESLVEAGFDHSLLDKALGDPSTWQAVVDEHESVVTRFGAFGVPTIILDGGEGPVIFGPVIANPPDDAEAVELWHHVVWLARNENFAEIKRDRNVRVELEEFAWRREQRRKEREAAASS